MPGNDNYNEIGQGRAAAAARAKAAAAAATAGRRGPAYPAVPGPWKPPRVGRAPVRPGFVPSGDRYGADGRLGYAKPFNMNDPSGPDIAPYSNPEGMATYRDALDAWAAAQAAGVQNPYGNSNGNGGYGGGGGGYGGGGGGGASAKYDPTAEYAALDAMLATMNGAVSADQLSATTAYSNLDTYMQGLGDPYAQIGPASSAQVQSEDLSRLLQDQGGSDAGLRAQAQFLQATNNAGASAADRRRAMLSASQQSWNQSSRTSGQLAGAQQQDALLAQQMAMRAAVESRRAAAAARAGA